jgi:hypothetical protein
MLYYIYKMRKGKAQTSTNQIPYLKEILTMKRTTLENIKDIVIASNAVNSADLVTEIDAEIARLVAKANYLSPAEKAKKEASAILYNDILALVGSSDAPITVKEIRDTLGTNYPAQKYTAVVNRLVADGKLARTYDKRTAYYTLA